MKLTIKQNGTDKVQRTFTINKNLVEQTMTREGFKTYDSYFNYIIKLGYNTSKEIAKVRKILDGIPMCPNCDGLNVIKHGLIYLKTLDCMKQRWICKDCGRTFSNDTLYR